jgi:uncharacterized membrane protein
MAALLALVMVLPPYARGEDAEGALQMNVTSFRDDLTVDREVAGSVQSVFGSVTINASVAGDVVVFGGNIHLGPNARVGGEVVAFGGKVTGLEASRDVTTPARVTLEAMNDPRSVIGYALKLTLLLGWIVASVVLVLINGREVRSAASELLVSPYHTFALGLVAFTSFVLTAVVFSYLVPFMVGIPLLAVLAVLAMMIKIFGLVSVFHAVGSAVARPKNRAELAGRKWFRGDLAMVLLGAIILGALRLLPYVGNFIWIAASLFGVGVALATRFGRREPWFLAWSATTEEAR